MNFIYREYRKLNRGRILFYTRLLFSRALIHVPKNDKEILIISMQTFYLMNVCICYKIKFLSNLKNLKYNYNHVCIKNVWLSNLPN